MREAIERVIADLELLSFAYGKRYLNNKDKSRVYCGGVEDGLDIAINKLKEVLATADNNTRNPAEPERDGQQEQSQ